MLLGGVMLDLGYAPQNLGYIDAIGASGRNASHSFVAVSTLASIGFLDRRHANIWLGIAIGGVTHLWRDMVTGTVPLMWPMTDMVYGTSHMRYIAGLTGMAIAMVGSGALLDVDAQARGGEPTM